MAGKGDTPRPLSIPADDFAARWELTFGRTGKMPFNGDTTGLRVVPLSDDPVRPAVAGLRDQPPEP